MRILTHTSDFRKEQALIFLAAGFFDGVHLGHQAVLRDSLLRARECGGEAWVLTFDRHPLSVLAPSKAPPLLTSLEERLRLFEKLGMDGALVLPFTRPLAVQEPEAFVRTLCGHAGAPGAVRIAEIRCGDNWRFGRRASGDPHLLARLGGLYGFEVRIVPYTFYKGGEISSTRIRQALREGELDAARQMLGRPYSLIGTVVRGRGQGGPVFHFPTANLIPDPTAVLPPCGVYAVEVETSNGLFFGVADLGIRPTITDGNEGQIVLETHLLDFEGDLYGQMLRVSFLKKIRDEVPFSSCVALSEQIQRDIVAARELVRTVSDRME